jgi:hypothetical protein
MLLCGLIIAIPGITHTLRLKIEKQTDRQTHRASKRCGEVDREREGEGESEKKRGRERDTHRWKRKKQRQ